MTCRRARQLLFDFFDGASNESLRAELDRHLGACAECERFAAEMTRCLALIRRAPVEPLDENFNWKVRLAIHRERNALRSRSASAGAWARAWNLRYVLSTSLAFAAVLVVGAVVLWRGQSPAPTPASVAARAGAPVRGASEVPVRSLVPGPGTAPWRNQSNHLVALGELEPGNAPASPGAIDEAQTEARIDSLILVDLMRMSPAERERYIQRRIIRLQYLQSQQDARTQRR
jgi:anti-sigma factor RsiW